MTADTLTWSERRAFAVVLAAVMGARFVWRHRLVVLGLAVVVVGVLTVPGVGL